ncbi:MAG: tRNA (guanosine(37)-N1)-methyltransferase TrmD [Candidatus Jorgensenbacteria bacterium]
MTTFNIITIFPEAFDSYLRSSLLGKAQDRKLIKINLVDPRSFAKDKHRMTDDRPFGGGAGMVMKPEPILKAVDFLKKKTKNKKNKVVILSAKGKQFNQKMAYAWAKKYKNIIFISGRYEGIDERVKSILKAEEVSIGPYVTTDGDVAIMAIISTVARLIPGVIKWESLREESFFSELTKKEQKNLTEYPHYTRPAVLEWKKKKYRVPSVLLSGDHKKIKEWRREHSRNN